MKQNLIKMAKPRTMNELRQEKEYQIAKANADLQAEIARNSKKILT